MFLELSSLVLAGVSVGISLWARRSSLRNQKLSNELQERLVIIEEARRDAEVEALQSAQIDAVAIRRGDHFELELRSLGPGLAHAVWLEFQGDGARFVEDPIDMPKGAIRRIARVPANWGAWETIERYIVHWKHPSGDAASTTFFQTADL